MMQAPSTAVMAKSAVWYTVSNFMTKALGFLTVPIFSRVMSQADYGSYGTFTSMLSVMLILTGFDAYSSVIRSKHDVEDDMDSYILSVLAVNTVVTLIFYALFLVFPEVYCDIFKVNRLCINIMFLYLFSTPAFNLICTWQRAYYKYKTFVILTALISVGAVVLSLAFVLTAADKLAARIVGQYLPGILVGGVLFVYIIVRGRRIKLAHCRYVLQLCVPLLPHLLSLFILTSSNMVVLSWLCGSEAAAVFSVANSAANIATILFDSANKAWAPWLLDNLEAKRDDSIRRVSNLYLILLLMAVFLVCAFGPEIIFILGGEAYEKAVYLMPLLLMGCAFKVAYTMYVNVEFYEKKTGITAVATLFAAALEIALSIPLTARLGYIGAGMASLIGYFLLLVAHYIGVRRMGREKVFDRRVMFGSLGILFVGLCVLVLLYQITALRYALLAAIFVSLAVMAIGSRSTLREALDGFQGRQGKQGRLR